MALQDGIIGFGVHPQRDYKNLKVDSEQWQEFEIEHNIGEAYMVLRYTFRDFRLFVSTYLQDSVRKVGNNQKHTCMFT